MNGDYMKSKKEVYYDEILKTYCIKDGDTIFVSMPKDEDKFIKIHDDQNKIEVNLFEDDEYIYEFNQPLPQSIVKAKTEEDYYLRIAEYLDTYPDGFKMYFPVYHDITKYIKFHLEITNVDHENKIVNKELVASDIREAKFKVKKMILMNRIRTKNKKGDINYEDRRVDSKFISF